MVARIELIITPANMLPACPEAVNMAVRFAISCGLLQTNMLARDLKMTSEFNLLPRANNV